MLSEKFPKPEIYAKPSNIYKKYLVTSTVSAGDMLTEQSLQDAVDSMSSIPRRDWVYPMMTDMHIDPADIRGDYTVTYDGYETTTYKKIYEEMILKEMQMRINPMYMISGGWKKDE